MLRTTGTTPGTDPGSTPASTSRTTSRTTAVTAPVARRRALAAGAVGALALVATGLPGGAGAADSALISRVPRPRPPARRPGFAGARFAVDGDQGTRWASAQDDADAWLRIDLGAPATLDEVVVRWEAAYASAYEIQVSDDGSTWTTVADVTDGDGGVDTLDVDAAGRYVQLQGVQRGTGYGYSLWELEVYGTGGAPHDGDDLPVFDDEVTHHEFQANCTVEHLGYDDPIVFPGQPGASHLHSFMGNTSTDAFTTIESLFANPETSCTNPNDLSAYWFPTIQNGDDPVVAPYLETIYYKAGIDDYRSVQPFPAGLRLIAGDMMATPESFASAPGAVEGWECGDLTQQWSIPEHCAEGSDLNIRYQAPSCWNGVDLDSPNHKAHMAYPVNGECPLTHPVPVPMLELKIGWPVSGDMSQVHLVSGSDQSWHYDFMNGWDPAILDALVTHCINGGLQCNPQGYDQYKPHRGAALTADFELP